MSDHYCTDRVIGLNATDGGGSALPVVIAPASSVIVPGTKPTVPTSTLTEIVAFTNSGSVLWLDGWSGKGQYDGDWYLEINGAAVHEGNSLATNSPGRAYTSPLKIADGILVRIMVTHYGAATGEFEGTLFGHRNT